MSAKWSASCTKEFLKSFHQSVAVWGIVQSDLADLRATVRIRTVYAAAGTYFPEKTSLFEYLKNNASKDFSVMLAFNYSKSQKVVSKY
jgi:hypothetical protein